MRSRWIRLYDAVHPR